MTLTSAAGQGSERDANGISRISHVISTIYASDYGRAVLRTAHPYSALVAIWPLTEPHSFRQDGDPRVAGL